MTFTISDLHDLNFKHQIAEYLSKGYEQGSKQLTFFDTVASKRDVISSLPHNSSLKL